MTKYLLVFFIFINTLLFSQVDNPVKWKITSKQLSDCEFEIVFDGTIENGWHLYSLQKLNDDGPMPSAIYINKSKDYEPIGKPTEGKAIKTHDKVFDVDVMYFENTVQLKQRIKVKVSNEVVVKGSFEYQACTEEKCIFPPATPFEIKLKAAALCAESASNKAKEVVDQTPVLVTNENETAELDSLKTTTVSTQIASATIAQGSLANTEDESSIEGKVWWLVFLSGFGWGFLALFTPCVFPLIPMNVSFFLKRSKNKTRGKINALLYALSIIVIFVALGLGISAIWGGGALNTFATSAGFNLVIFVLLLIFAASFLGAFEIVLPSKFVNKIDKQSDRGGYAGIFFMALTLVVVSFSCTGPMVGNALVAASTSGNKSGAFWAMFGFSSGLALPFGLFAFFPSMLNTLPKSGGWLNTVKVVLGFLELALALKFASNVDLVYQLGILTREVFLTFWIVIFALTSLYLMGIFKTAHDSKVEFLSVTRLLFVILFFSVTIYLIPGLWGAPLKLFSGILPPADYAEAPNGFGTQITSNSNKLIDAEFAPYIEFTKYGVPHFKNDYELALAYAKKTNKPLMVDFTGHACANCRKTEDYIWPNENIGKRLTNDVVLVSLFVDDKRQLNEKDFIKVFWYGQERVITTIGDKFKYLEEVKYNQSTQPLYVLLDSNEQLLNKPRGYKSGIEEYLLWLDEGIANFKRK